MSQIREIPVVNSTSGGADFQAHVLPQLVDALVRFDFSKSVKLIACDAGRCHITVDGAQFTIENVTTQEREALDVPNLPALQLCKSVWGGGIAGGNCNGRVDACAGWEVRECVLRLIKAARVDLKKAA